MGCWWGRVLGFVPWFSFVLVSGCGGDPAVAQEGTEGDPPSTSSTTDDEVACTPSCAEAPTVGQWMVGPALPVELSSIELVAGQTGPIAVGNACDDGAAPPSTLAFELEAAEGESVWQPIDPMPLHLEAPVATVLSDGTLIVSSRWTGGQTLRKRPSQPWEEVAAVPTGDVGVELLAASATDVLIAGSEMGLGTGWYRSDDHGDSWFEIDGINFSSSASLVPPRSIPTARGILIGWNGNRRHYDEAANSWERTDGHGDPASPVVMFDGERTFGITTEVSCTGDVGTLQHAPRGELWDIQNPSSVERFPYPCPAPTNGETANWRTEVFGAGSGRAFALLNGRLTTFDGDRLSWLPDAPVPVRGYNAIARTNGTLLVIESCEREVWQWSAGA
ncbi:MAG: hypothetical protein AAGA54_17300 [Myxococcota bacterium]